ncbi:hypothetical protein [Serratia sp. N21D137]|uniref:hypothetical protein n=1 Tax=Serratia sp. N21D137 TaxID=3397495 RepID=UPI0039DFD1D5
MITIENFDCTQMISFEYYKESKQGLLGLSNFEKIGFEVLLDKDIRQVKKTYFQSGKSEYFIEFVNKEFSGEFEDWVDFDNPPKVIIDFACEIKNFAIINDLSNVKIFLTFFAEKGITKDHVVSCEPNDLLHAFFMMSKNNFDIWVDNLIIDLTMN